MSTKTDKKSSTKTEETKTDPPKYSEEELEEHRKKLIKKIRFMQIGC